MVIQIVYSALQIYWFLLLGRVIMSWINVGPDSPIAPIRSFLFQVTEPVLGPLRSVLPRTGMFDLSTIVALIGVRLLMSFVQSLG